MRDAAVSRARMSGEERREQLIVIGRQVFAKRGYEAATVEEIADRAKISKPIVYQHFGGKERLYAVVVDREVRHLLDLIHGSLKATTPRAALESTVSSFLKYIEDDPEGFRMLLREGPAIVVEREVSILDSISAHVESILAPELGAQGLDKKAAPVLARALVGMVALTGQWWVKTGQPKRKIVADHLVNLAWNGLGNLEKES